MTQFARATDSANDALVPTRLRLVVSPPVVGQRRYPQQSLSTARVLSTLDLIFDGVDAVIGASQLVGRLFARNGRTRRHPAVQPKAAAWHPSTGRADAAHERPRLRLVGGPSSD